MANPDVTFRYTSGGQLVVKVLRGADMLPSREGLGVWKVDTKAWKVFRTRDQYDVLSADYTRAAVDAGLPMGRPSFQQGTVIVGNGQPSEGFVLIIEWMSGNRFLHTSASFRAELRRPPEFPRSKSSVDYQRMKSGTEAANKVGLRDPQGYLLPGIYEPLRFFDVHTGWNSATNKYDYSAVAEQILNEAVAWGQ